MTCAPKIDSGRTWKKNYLTKANMILIEYGLYPVYGQQAYDLCRGAWKKEKRRRSTKIMVIPSLYQRILNWVFRKQQITARG